MLRGFQGEMPILIATFTGGFNVETIAWQCVECHLFLRAVGR